MPAEIAVTAARISGDQGGQGISRFHWQRIDAAAIGQADCNSANAAVIAFYTAVRTLIPLAISVTVDPLVQILEFDTARLDRLMNAVASGSPVVGTGSGNYAVGVGARINWKSPFVIGRRFARANLMLVPLANGAFASTGLVGSGSQTTVQSAANGLINALTTANLQLVVWHRPQGTPPAGGVVAGIAQASVPLTPAGLRSRRT